MRTFVRLLIVGVVVVLLLSVRTFALPVTSMEAISNNPNPRVTVAISSFSGDAGAAEVVTSTVTADLDRASRFDLVNPGSGGPDDAQRIAYSDWKARGVDALVVGSVRPSGDGRYETRFRLYDVQKGMEIGAKALVAGPKDLRNVAHRISDYVFEKLTGKQGTFSTRLAYITKRADRYLLVIADADGGNPQPALASPRPITTPAWSPEGTRLALVSYEATNSALGQPHPIVFTHYLASGQRRVSFNPIAGATALSVAWSPDGANLAVMSHELGKSVLYLVSPDGKDSKEISISKSEDANPAFSADGQQIYFDSNRSGMRQIYRQSVVGGMPELTIKGSNETFAPSLSPDGKTLAYIVRDGQQDHLALMDLGRGTSSTLPYFPASQRLSFSANGEFVVFSEKSNGGYALKAASVDTHRSVPWVVEPEAANSSEFALSPFVGKTQLSENSPKAGIQADAASARGWADRIRSKIRSNAIFPPDTPPNLTAEFSVIQFPSGEIAKVALVSSSGDAPFDAAIERAILKSSPLPQAPTTQDFVRDLRIRYSSSDGDGGSLRPYIGVVVQDVSKELTNAIGLKGGTGTLISSTDDSGPAAKAGIERGDIVLKVGAQPVESTKSFASLVAATPPGDSIPMEIWRKGERKTIAVTVGDRPANNTTLVASPDPAHRNARPVYPLESRRSQEQGKTTLKVQVDAQGIAQTVEIKESSGFARLDQAASDAVKTWHFVPAMKEGIPTAAWVLVPIAFRLDEPDAESRSEPERMGNARVGNDKTGVDEFNKRPRKKFVASRVENMDLASYLESWKQKTIRVGMQNYPAKARGKLYGSVVVYVELNAADGSLREVEVSRSSGHKILDAAALDFVRKSAPYGPVPKEAMGAAEILCFAQTLQFVPGDETVQPDASGPSQPRIAKGNNPAN